MPAHSESDVGIAVDQVLGAELLRELPEENYRLLRPFLLTLYRAPDYYWVAPDQFVLHGLGSTPEEAVENYAYALLDYYEDLRDHREVLAPHLIEHLEYIETIIAEEHISPNHN